MGLKNCICLLNAFCSATFVVDNFLFSKMATTATISTLFSHEKKRFKLPDFWRVGSSCRKYRRQQIIDAESHKAILVYKTKANFKSDEFEITPLR